MFVERSQIEAALPGYEIGATLGQGSGGLVLEGRHRHISRPAAIKILTRPGPADRAGFRREADVLAALDHPHIVRIYDYVERDDLSLLVMEHLSGGTLTARLTATSPAGACGLGLAAADALAAAHAAGVLHRDVKPSNMMFAEDGALKLVDFGISKFFAGAGTLGTSIAGTPGYMAPEQISGGRVGPGTDLYALGVVLYRLLSGAMPFDSSLPPVQLWRRQLGTPVRSPDGVAKPLAEVVLRALRRSLADRHPSAHDFAVALAAAATSAFGPDWLESSGAVARVDRAVLDATRGPGSRAEFAPVRNAPARLPPTPEPTRRVRPAGPLDPPLPVPPAPTMPPDRVTIHADGDTLAAPAAIAATDDRGVVDASTGRPGIPRSDQADVLLEVASDRFPGGAGPGDSLVVEPIQLSTGVRVRPARALLLLALTLLVLVAGIATPVLLISRPGRGPAAVDFGVVTPASMSATPAPVVAGSVHLVEQPLDGGANARVEGIALAPGGVGVAVGRRGGGAGGGVEPVAWRWVAGSRWVPAPVPLPAGSIGGAMAAVTFLTGPGFVAVGSVDMADAGSAVSVAAVWTSPDGSRWTARAGPTPVPAGSNTPTTGLTDVVSQDGGLLAVGRSPGPLEPDLFWRSPDGTRWAPTIPTGLRGPGEQHVDRVVETRDGRLLGAGTEPEGGTSVTRLRWSADGTDWHLAAAQLSRDVAVSALARLPDGRLLATGSRQAADGRRPWISLGDPTAARWADYAIVGGSEIPATAGLFAGEVAGDAVLVAGDTPRGGGEGRTAAVWSLRPPQPPAGW